VFVELGMRAGIVVRLCQHGSEIDNCAGTTAVLQNFKEGPQPSPTAEKKINLSTGFAGRAVGLKKVEEGTWLVSFMDYDRGYIDLEEKTLQPIGSPFGPKVLPMS
jgi:hypothetical protein